MQNCSVKSWFGCIYTLVYEHQAVVSSCVWGQRCLEVVTVSSARRSGVLVKQLFAEWRGKQSPPASVELRG